MSQLESELAVEISRHDWHALRTFIGDGSILPKAIMALASAKSEEHAMAAYWKIENVAMVQGRLSEAAEAVTSCLLVAMNSADGPVRSLILDLLCTISGGYEEHVDNETVGRASVQSCVEMMAGRLEFFIEELLRTGDSNCVDILLMCGLYVESTRTVVRQTLVNAMSLAVCRPIQELIEASIDYLDQQTSPSAESEDGSGSGSL